MTVFPHKYLIFFVNKYDKGTEGPLCRNNDFKQQKRQ